VSADIDIDFFDREAALNVISYVRASRLASGKLVPHNTGIYLQDIPSNPITNCSNIEYKAADERGYFKFDFLNVGVYKGVQDEEHLDRLISKEPMWELLEHQDFSDMLFHVNGHSDILKETKPRSLEQLAAVLAMIRPARRYLVGKGWDEILQKVWALGDDKEYFFKKAHSFSYAMAVIMQMNLICENLTVEVTPTGLSE
jgi:hypothetical protein